MLVFQSYLHYTLFVLKVYGTRIFFFYFFLLYSVKI